MNALTSQETGDRELSVAHTPLAQLTPSTGIGCLLNDGLASSHPLSMVVKVSLDLVLASVLLVLTAPVIGFAALLIKLTSRGPVIYRQQRIGRGGKKFTILKLRTMMQDAEHRLPEQPSCVRFIKFRNDSRITPVGRFLRRSSIDELPQLINVLRGEMSLVGPRPLVQKEVDALPWPAWVTRYRVQPGITGLWQVSGRNNTTDTERLQLDIDYVRNWSLLQDLKIMIKTVPAIIFGRGAY
jgi:lipopolysaccharide/colanic/teichoic acid biosynthesis glycosyltransferase